MKTKTVYLLAGVLVGLVVVSSWERDSEAATGPATIRITNVQDTVVRVDVGAKGKSPGDMEIVRQRLYNQRVTSRSIGRSELLCTFVDRRAFASAAARTTSRRARSSSWVSLLYRQFYELAILGRHGSLRQRPGLARRHAHGRTPGPDSMVFRLVG